MARCFQPRRHHTSMVGTGGLKFGSTLSFASYSRLGLIRDG